MKSRITITMDSDCVKIIDDYADVLGVSRSSVISGMLNDASPTLKKVSDELRGFLDSMRGKLNDDDLSKFKEKMLSHIIDKLQDDFSIDEIKKGVVEDR